jgi:hypothetical protein
MSGSPILSPNGAAIGVCCTGSHRGGKSDDGDNPYCAEGGPNPRLMLHLPAGLLRELTTDPDEVSAKEAAE